MVVSIFNARTNSIFLCAWSHVRIFTFRKFVLGVGNGDGAGDDVDNVYTLTNSVAIICVV